MPYETDLDHDRFRPDEPDGPVGVTEPELPAVPAGNGRGADWQEIQLRFLDDPRDASEQAQQLVDRAIEEFTRSLAARKAELDSWQGAEQPDTEQLRIALRGYRDLLDELLPR